MGTAKVIFLSGLYIIMGVYTVGFNKANTSVRNIADYQASHVEAAQIAQTGVQFAVRDLGTSMPSTLPSTTGLTMMGGSMSYNCDNSGLPADQARITAVGTYNGQQVTTIAIVKLMATLPDDGGKFRWNSWQIVQIQTLPETRALSTWNG